METPLKPAAEDSPRALVNSVLTRPRVSCTSRGAVERLRAVNDGRERGLRDAAEEHGKGPGDPWQVTKRAACVSVSPQGVVNRSAETRGLFRLDERVKSTN